MGASAGLLQGSYSFVLTLTMTLVMEYLMTALRALPGRGALTVMLVSAMTFSVAYGLQSLNGTPEVLLTILPGFFLGTIYCAVYVAGLAALDASAKPTAGRCEP